ncbi:MAG: rod-binding protein [Alphaproteobacteria bacterium]|nr:rod-binding protein [Alphaproteobacteria bacterium]
MIDSPLSGPMSPTDLSAAQAAGRSKTVEASLRTAIQAGDREGIREAAEKFESQFLSQMLNHMMKDLSAEGMFGGGQAEKIWRDLYVQEVSDVITRRGGIGVTEAIERQLIKLQEVS